MTIFSMHSWLQLQAGIFLRRHFRADAISVTVCKALGESRIEEKDKWLTRLHICDTFFRSPNDHEDKFERCHHGFESPL